VVFTNLALIRV